MTTILTKYYHRFTVQNVAKNRDEKLKNLAEKLGKYVSKAYKDKSFNFIFSSQELRSLALKIEKVHKAINKQLSFLEFENRINNIAKKTKGETAKETQELHWGIFREQIRLEQELMVKLQNIQWALSKINMLCTILNVYEYVNQRDKENKEKEDANILIHSIFEALVEGSEL